MYPLNCSDIIFIRVKKSKQYLWLFCDNIPKLILRACLVYSSLSIVFLFIFLKTIVEVIEEYFVVLFQLELS